MDATPVTVAGSSYDAAAPDTLDLVERAALVLNALGGCIDPKLMTMYGSVHFACAHPHLSHWASADTLLDPKFAESFVMMRVMSGSDRHAELEERFRQALISRVDDGLYWDRYSPDRPWRNSYAVAYYGQGKDEDFCTLPGTGRLVRALLAWREVYNTDAWDGLIRQIVAGMRRILVCKDDYGYYPEHGGWGEPCAYPRSGWLNTDEAQGETEGGEGSVICMQGHQMYAAAQWYRASGDEVALDLARRLARYCLLPRFWGGLPDPDREKGKAQKLPGHIAARLPDPAYTNGSELGHWYSHFHARAIALRGILEYAQAAEDEPALEFVRRSYEFTLSQGIARMGWINCYPGATDTVEGCALGDLAALGVRLSDLGLGDYWDDVDGLVRNHLVEQQLADREELERFVALQTAECGCAKNAAPGQLCYDDVLDRALGSFIGVSLPCGAVRPFVMHCCTGNASQGLYYAWEGTLRERTGRATVNLLLNRAGSLVDVDSHLPHEGNVVIRNKAVQEVAVRLPWWVRAANVQLQLNGRPVAPHWLGRYVVLRGLSGKETITLGFPIRQETHTYTVNAHSPAETAYRCTFRGSTLVEIAPGGDGPNMIPFYRRQHLCRPSASCRQVRRFVPARVFSDW